MSYRTLLRWAALPVTNRRWGAPLCAIALGFGLFVGVAIGPNAAGTLATAPFQVIEMPPLGGGEEAEAPLSEEPLATSSTGDGDFGGEAESSVFAPVESVEEEPLAPVEEGPSSGPAPAATEKEEAEPEEPELVGTVVHVNPAAGSYTVAEAGGVMSAVHAGRLPAVGTAVEVPIQTLANGTLAEAGKRAKTGNEKRAKLAGIVTFVVADAAAPAYVVSNRGTSVLVRVDPDPTGVLPSLPALGAFVTATVEIAPPAPALMPTPPPPAEVASTIPATCAPDLTLPPLAPVAAKGSLWQRSISAPGAPFTHAELSGIVIAVCPQTAQLLLSADGIGESAGDRLLAVPAELDVSGLTVGDSAILAVDIAADGALTLTGLAGDERLKGADDAKATQGDLVPDKSEGER